jgi:glycosyltransferase involved in cell wall biosynthesis
MAPDLPLVSVVIPTHDRADLVCAAIESALAQTHREIEVLVVDDGSTDRTREAVESRARSDPRIRYLRQEHAGPGAARNLGIRNARGELIAFLDSDDSWYPENLARQVEKLLAHPDAALVFCDAKVEGARPGRETRFSAKSFDGDTSLGAMVDNNFAMAIPTTVIRRRVLDEIGLFDETLLCVEDWDLWIRILSRYPAVVVDEVLAVIHRRSDSMSRRRGPEQWRCWLRLWLERKELLLGSGCSPATVRRKIAHAHKKLAQTLRAAGRVREARRHYLDWWRIEPWRLRGLGWWTVLTLTRDRTSQLP